MTMARATSAPFWLSLRVATLATALIVLVGHPVRPDPGPGAIPRQRAVAGLLVLPLVMPPTVLGYGLLLVLGRQGWLGRWLEATWGVSIVFHWSGAVVASGVAAFPMFLLPARGAFEGVDPAMEDAARLLGRGEVSVFPPVTVPLAWRGLVAGSVLAFARALGDFGATIMVAGDIPGLTQTASMAIYDAVAANDPSQGRPALALGRARLDGRGRRRPEDVALARDGALSGASEPALEVRLAHRVHPGLAIDVDFQARRRVRRPLRPVGLGQVDDPPPDRRPDPPSDGVRPAGRLGPVRLARRRSTSRSGPAGSG